jgi:dolichol-phosphate mannosyltransferase
MNRLNSIISSLFWDKEVRRFLKFCVVGLSGVGVNMFFLWFFTEILKIFYLFSSPLAIELSVLNNFVLNDLWTWRDRGRPGKMNYFKRMVQYHISVSVSAIIANIFLLWFLTEIFHFYYLLSNLLGIAAGAVLNYFINDRWTFRYQQS